jgi:hypothetical protein
VVLRVKQGAVLLGGGAGSYVSEIRDAVTGEKLVQEEDPVRGTEPVFFDRYRVKNVLNITVRKQVSGFARALDTALRRRQTLDGTGALTIELVDGGTTHTWTAENAGWKQTTAGALGVSARITYQVTCGAFTYTSTATTPDDQVDGGTLDDMGTEILLRRGTRADILAFIAAEGFSDFEPWCETDGGRTGTGNRGYNTMAKDLGTIALSTAGDTTLALVTWANVFRGLITVAAGAGAYVRNVVLPNTATDLNGDPLAFVAGDLCELRVEVAASGNPTVNFYATSTAGTNLLPIAGDAALARNYIATFRHTGAAWALFDLRQVNS